MGLTDSMTNNPYLFIYRVLSEVFQQFHMTWLQAAYLSVTQQSKDSLQGEELFKGKVIFQSALHSMLTTEKECVSAKLNNDL
jgi:hypothetical protein